jgi:hypothetical protein
MRLSWKGFLTHLAALAIGWACVDRILGNHESSAGTGASSVKTKSGERLPGAKTNAEDDGPLARWMGNTPDPETVERLKHESVAEVADALFAKSADKDLSEILGLISVHGPSGLDSSIEGLRELWLAEPKEMLEWCKALPQEKRQKLSVFLLDGRLASAIPDDQLESVDGTDSHIQWLRKERGRRAGRAGIWRISKACCRNLPRNPGYRAMPPPR